jgi:mono/diheme cytochrome c family protein
MANGTRGGYTPDRHSGGGFGAFLLGILFTIVAVGIAGWVYLRYGHPPVAVADQAFPMEAQIVHVPLNARIAREIEQPPFGASEDAFEAGARLYVTSCASCHGTPRHNAPYAKWMYPVAPQLWQKHTRGNVVGVSDDEPGETYWKIKNGIRLTGMPEFQHLYSTAQMWDIALLLKNADQPLPDPVAKILATGDPAGSTSATP